MPSSFVTRQGTSFALERRSIDNIAVDQVVEYSEHRVFILLCKEPPGIVYLSYTMPNQSEWRSLSSVAQQCENLVEGYLEVWIVELVGNVPPCGAELFSLCYERVEVG